MKDGIDIDFEKTRLIVDRMNACVEAVVKEFKCLEALGEHARTDWKGQTSETFAKRTRVFYDRSVELKDRADRAAWSFKDYKGKVGGIIGNYNN